MTSFYSNPIGREIMNMYKHVQVCLLPCSMTIVSLFLLCSRCASTRWKLVHTFEHVLTCLRLTQWWGKRNPSEWCSNESINTVNLSSVLQISFDLCYLIISGATALTRVQIVFWVEFRSQWFNHLWSSSSDSCLNHSRELRVLGEFRELSLEKQIVERRWDTFNFGFSQ